MRGAILPDRDWINFIWKGSNKRRFQYCQNSCNNLLYLRAIQRHTRGEMIPPEMLGHVLIPHMWKEFVFDRGCSFILTSILNAGIDTQGSSHHWTRGGTEEEEYCRDLTKPRKFHYKTGWKHSENAVYGIHLGRTQEKSICVWAKRNRTQSSQTARCHLTAVNV